MNAATLLPLIWAGIIGVAVAFYVILDGFDLGIGMLFPFARDDAERERMLAAIAPFWDGNETWLVLGGGGLLVAFPRAYAIIMPALYLPIMVMLLALVFRGVTFEFRGLAQRKPFWNVVFATGSTVAGFCQGLVLGGLIQGIDIADGAFAGGPFDWATPFSVMCGLGVVAGYALLGATWLRMKTDGDMAERAAGKAKILLGAVIVFMAAVSIFTPLEFPRIADRWFTYPNLIYLAPVPILTALLALTLWRFLDRGPRNGTVSRQHRAVPARLSGSRDFDFSLHRAARPHDLGRSRSACEPDLHADRHPDTVALRAGLHGADLLAVPRQGGGNGRLSLTGRPHGFNAPAQPKRRPAGSCPSRSATAAFVRAPAAQRLPALRRPGRENVP